MNNVILSRELRLLPDTAGPESGFKDLLFYRARVRSFTFLSVWVQSFVLLSGPGRVRIQSFIFLEDRGPGGKFYFSIGHGSDPGPTRKDKGTFYA